MPGPCGPGLEKWGDASPLKPYSRPPVEVPKFIEFTFRPRYRDREFLYQKYVIEGRSAKEIARSILSSRSVVMTYLKKFEIPLHNGDAKKKSQIGFGEAWRERQVVVHKKEQELITKMQKLRTEGLSYWKVADV